jgi:hypothetical protein
MSYGYTIPDPPKKEPLKVPWWWLLIAFAAGLIAALIGLHLFVTGLPLFGGG